MSRGKLFVVSGASGVGKSTVLKGVMARCPELQFSVSATTREPRPGEEEGVNYFFVSEERFRAMIDAGEFLEYNLHNKAYYGTPRQQIEDKLEKGSIILDIEPNGAFELRRQRPDVSLIFIMPPSMEALYRRLCRRGDTSPEQIHLRMERARWEMEQLHLYDYVVINDQVETCVDQILHFIRQKLAEE